MLVDVTTKVWTWHLLRHEGLLNKIIEEVVDGKNVRGRPRLSFIDQVTKDIVCATYIGLKIWSRQDDLMS